jgi:hypothetical protein
MGRSAKAGGAVSRAKLALGVPLAMAADAALFAMLRRSRPCPFGLSDADATPAMLSSAGSLGLSRCTEVVLCYGRPLHTAGPLTEVETCFPGGEAGRPALQEMITRAVLRDQAWAREDWEGDQGVFAPGPAVRGPADGFERGERVVVVAGQQHRVPVISRGGYEALRFEHESMVVTAVARAGFPERPRFDVVEDLEPYLAEHRRFILSWLTIRGTSACRSAAMRQSRRIKSALCSTRMTH